MKLTEKQSTFIQGVREGFKTASLGVFVAACIIFMTVGISSTFDLLGGRTPAVCKKINEIL